MQHLDFTQVTYPEDVAESREVIRSLLASEREMARFEKRYIHRTGNILWADVSTTLLRDVNGEPLYMITSIADITEQKLVERLLALQAALLDLANDSILVRDMENKVVFWNRGAGAIVRLD